jgi:hypothetical protein
MDWTNELKKIIEKYKINPSPLSRNNAATLSQGSHAAQTS